MIKKITLTFVLFFSVLFISEGQRLDSLNRELQKNPHDSIKAAIYLRMANEMIFNNPDSAQKILDEVESLVSKNRDWLNFYNSKGLVYTNQGKFDLALNELLKALAIANEEKDSSEIARLNNNIGNAYYGVQNFEQAYLNFIQSQKIAEKKQDSLIIVISMHNIGRVLKELGQYQNAIKYLEEAMKLGDLIGDEEGHAYAFDEMGKVYLRQKKYNEAIEAFGKSIEESKEHDLKIIETETLIKRAEAYKILKEYDKSLEDLNKAMLFGTELKNDEVRAEALTNMATINIIRGNYGVAESQLVEALSLAENVHSLRVITTCYLEFSELYDRRNEYEKSLTFYKKHIYFRDSMLVAKRNEQTAQLQLQYNIDKKDLEIALLNERDQAKINELNNQKGLNNILAVILALSVFLLFTVYRSGQRRKKINSLLRLHQEETEEQKMELLELNNLKDKFFSIIAHDLRSPISSLSGVIDLLTGKNLTQDEMNMLLKTIRKQLDYTKELLDNLLDWALLQMDKLKVSKEAIDLKKLVEDNIELVKKTSIKHIDISNDVKDSVMINADKNMINLVLRNLLTNAIKFTNEGGNITVSKEKDNGEVIVTIKDNGVGISEENINKLFDRSQYFSTKGTANEKGAGLGLKLCQEFIERNGGRVWAESTEGEGSSFKFSLEVAEVA